MIRPPVEKYTRNPKAPDKAIQELIIQEPCCVPDCNAKADDFHHVKVPPLPIGSLQKGGHPRSHKWGAALCRPHHTIYHDDLGGVDEFEEVYNVNLDAEAERNFIEYWGEDYAD